MSGESGGGVSAVGARWQAALLDLYARGEPALDAFSAFYAENVRFEDPFHALSGKGTLMDLNRRFIEGAKRIDVRVTAAADAESTFFVAWTMVYEPRVLPSVTCDGVTHAKVEGGLIVVQRDFIMGSSGVVRAISLGSMAARLL